jgi:hypothetical protein
MDADNTLYRELTLIPTRVAAGIALLDQKDPDWWRADHPLAIDLDRLDMATTCDCIAGQRGCRLPSVGRFSYGYTRGTEQLGVIDDVAVGFDRPHGTALPQTWTDGSSEAYYKALGDEWRRVITERRAGIRLEIGE